MCPNLKSVVGIIMIIIAALCTLNAFVFASIVNPLYEFAQLWLQVACVGTAWLCMLFGMSIWFKQSVFFRPRHDLRVLMIVTLLGLLIANVATCVCYNSAMKNMGEYTVPEEIFTGYEMVFPTVTLVMCIIIIILIAITIGLLIYLTYTRYKAHT